MKKRQLALLLSLALACTSLAGCGEKDTPSDESIQSTESTESTDSSSDESESQPEESSETPSESSEPDIIGDNTEMTNQELSIKVADTIYKNNGEVNMMFSPLSLNLALGLLLDGADGQSKVELENYLGEDFSSFAKNYMQNEVDEYNYMHEGYDEWDSGYTTAFEIANSVWFRDNLTISDSYRSNVTDNYGAEVGSFSVENKEESASKINSWCSNKTHEMIQHVINPEQFEADLASILINSVYLESGWVEPWDEAWEEEDKTFTTFDGEVHNADMIKSSFGTYYENDKATGFAAPYINGMKFIGILPKEDGDFTLEELNIPELLANPDYSYDSVLALMPKLNFETEAALSDILAENGFSEVFNPETLDFISMTAEKDPIHVNSIIQKTKIELDENGTKAAAVTMIMMTDSAIAFEDEPKVAEVYLNRPFAFVIYDSNNDQIVFIGKVVNAEK